MEYTFEHPFRWEYGIVSTVKDACFKHVLDTRIYQALVCKHVLIYIITLFNTGN